MAANTTTSPGLPAEIPLRVLFGNADKTSPQISPDGKYYAYLANDANGVTNVHVKPILVDASSDELKLIDAKPQQVTHENHRPLWFFMWAKSLPTRRILYIQDNNGDENYHVHVVSFAMDEDHNIRDLIHRDLTPYDNVSVMANMIKLSPKHPDTAFIYLNKRDERFHDGHKVNLVTGETELVLENPGGVENWLVDEDFRVVGVLAQEDGSEVLRVPDTDQSSDAQWKTITTWPLGETVVVQTTTKDGSGVYVCTTLSHSTEGLGSDTSRLVLLSLKDGSLVKEIAHDKLCDVFSVSINEDTRSVNFVMFDYLKPRMEIVDDGIRSDMELVLSTVVGRFKLVSASADNQMWVYSDGPDDASLSSIEGPRSAHFSSTRGPNWLSTNFRRWTRE